MATPEQIANLRNHAAFVGEQNSISMCSYARDSRGWYVQPYEVHSCGTAMCAAGHGPLNKDLPPPFDGEDWSSYSDRIFGCSARDAFGRKCFSMNLPNDPAIISKLMLEVADELEASQ